MSYSSGTVPYQLGRLHYLIRQCLTNWGGSIVYLIWILTGHRKNESFFPLPWYQNFRFSTIPDSANMAERQSCSPYVLSIVWQCKWRSRSRMIVEIQKFCYHGNMTSHFSSLFPTSKNSLLQNEAKCKPFLVKMSFICIRIKNQLHINGFALSIAFKLRLGALRKMVCPYFMSQKQRAVKRRKTLKVWSKLV